MNKHHNGHTVSIGHGRAGFAKRIPSIDLSAAKKDKYNFPNYQSDLWNKKRAQVPTILIFLVAIVLAGFALFALLTFNKSFTSQSQPLSEMMQEIDFNKQYVLAQISVILNETESSCFSCSADEFKSRFQSVTQTKESRFLYEGAGNFYGRIRAGDFTITKTGETTTITIEQVFVQSQRRDNKIKRFFDINIEQ